MDPIQLSTTEDFEQVTGEIFEEIIEQKELSFLNNVNDSEEESLSSSIEFINKDSIEFHSSLASCADIQQNNMSINYKSTVSPSMIKEVTKEIFEEITEKKKGLSFFNNVSDNEEESLSIEIIDKDSDCKSSLSITEMQNRLMEMLQENVKLKDSLRQNNKYMKQQVNCSAICQKETKMINKSELEQNTPELTDLISKMAIEKCKDYIISIISEKLADEELQCKLQQLKAGKELESATIALHCKLNYDDNYIETVENLKCSEMCSAKDQEIASLKKSIALLKQKLQCVLTSVELHNLSETSSNLSHQEFVQNMKQHNDITQELTKCFVKQLERVTAMEKGLMEITDILSVDDDNSKMQCKEKLCQCCKQLVDEQIKIMTNKQTLIKSQNQPQKISSGYNSVLYELEMTINENTKLNVLKAKNAHENLQMEQLEQIKRDRQSLENKWKTELEDLVKRMRSSF